MDLQNPLKKETNPKKKKIKKGILGAVIVVLVGALGLELGNFDLDLGKLISGEGVEESRVYTTWSGRSCEEKDTYNCEDFANQPAAQDAFDECGGEGKDVNGLDGDKDGIACEALPQG